MILNGGNRSKAQKSFNDLNPERILYVLDRIRKRGFYGRMYLDHTIDCDGLEHAIFEIALTDVLLFF